MNTCVCMAESLHCSPGIITTLLIGCTPIQNGFGVKKINKKKRFGFSSEIMGELLKSFKWMSHGNRFELYFKNTNFGSDKGFDWKFGWRTPKKEAVHSKFS